MKYKYIVTFYGVDSHLITLYNTVDDRVEEVDVLYEIYRKGYMIGINYHTDELMIVNMSNVIRAKISVEEIL